jgi:hypothetical protein
MKRWFVMTLGAMLLGGVPLARADDVSKRPPAAGDDSAHGYAAGNLWNVPGLGLWVCTSATPGEAVWQMVQTGILPLDSVPGVVLHGWGTRRLRAGFTGAPLQVTLGGTTTTVPFDSAGTIKPAMLAKIIGPKPKLQGVVSPQMWSGGVTTLYDQSTGPALDMTVPDGAVAPQISPSYLTGGSPYIGFADSGLNWLTDDLSPGGDPQHPRLANLSATASATDLTMIVVMRNGAAGITDNTVMSFNSEYPLSLFATDISAITTIYAGAGIWDGVQIPLNFQIPQSASVFGVTSTAGGVVAFDDDNASYAGPALTPNYPAEGLYFGGVDATELGDAMALSVAIEGRGLTAAQLLALRESLTDTFQLTPQIRQRIIESGDSIGAGADGWMDHTPMLFAESQFTEPYLIYNMAIGGSEIGGTGSQAADSEIALFSTLVAPLYTPYALNIFYDEGGTNSLFYGNTPQQTLAAWSQWNGLVRGLGANTRIIGQTLGGATIIPENERIIYNAFLRSHASEVDVLDDEGGTFPFSDPTLMETSRTLTESLGIHRSPYAQSLEGGLLAPAVNRLTGP